MRRLVPVVVLAASCGRPTDVYDVHLYGQGTYVGDVEVPPEPRSGLVELSRWSLEGSNLGLGFTGLAGDQPIADGARFVIASASFGVPPDPSYDRGSTLFPAGPRTTDSCHTVIGARAWPGAVVLADVGDHVRLQGDGVDVRLPRDPSVYPSPSGEAWYVGYGSGLLPDVAPGGELTATWRGGASLELSFPGMLPPEEATFAAIPAPWSGAGVVLPEAVDDLAVGGVEVAAPSGSPVRFAGPWVDALELTWTPSSAPSPLTVVVRTLGEGLETACDCASDCGDGFSCSEGWCVGDDGASWSPLGEVVCTVEDDGAFTLAPQDVIDLDVWAGTDVAAGAVLIVARTAEGLVSVPDALTFNGRRVPDAGVRLRATDAIVTRLEAP